MAAILPSWPFYRRSNQKKQLQEEEASSRGRANLSHNNFGIPLCGAIPIPSHSIAILILIPDSNQFSFDPKGHVYPSEFVRAQLHSRIISCVSNSETKIYTEILTLIHPIGIQISWLIVTFLCCCGKIYSKIYSAFFSPPPPSLSLKLYLFLFIFVNVMIRKEKSQFPSGSPWNLLRTPFQLFPPSPTLPFASCFFFFFEFRFSILFSAIYGSLGYF